MKVILISLDDLRADCVNMNQDKLICEEYDDNSINPKTDTIDSLIKRGTFIKRCFSTAPYTTASHASMLTGLYPSTHGIREYFRNGISNNIKTVFEIFKEAGYKTVFFTDWPYLLGEFQGLKRGADVYITCDEMEVTRYFDEHPDENVFAFVHFGTIHYPYGLTSSEYDGEYFAKKVEQVSNLAGVPEQQKLEKEWLEKNYSLQERTLRQRYLKSVENLYKQKKYLELIKLYVEGVEYFDKNRFKNFISTIDVDNFIKNGIICLTADHGETWNDNIYAHHNGLTESVTNVPLAFIGEGVKKGQTLDMVCSSVDIVPTLLDFAGLHDVLDSFEGISLKDSINNHQVYDLLAYSEVWAVNRPEQIEKVLDFMAMCKSANRVLNIDTLADTRVECLRGKQWKLKIKTELKSNIEKTELFDIEVDRLEKKDVSTKNEDIVKDYSEKIREHRRTSQGEAICINSDQLEQIKAGLGDLGYIIR